MFFNCNPKGKLTKERPPFVGDGQTNCALFACRLLKAMNVGFRDTHMSSALGRDAAASVGLILENVWRYSGGDYTY